MSGSLIDFIIVVTRSIVSSNLFVFLFIVAIKAAMLPKIKAESKAPEIITAVANTVCTLVLGASSFPTMVRIE